MQRVASAKSRLLLDAHGDKQGENEGVRGAERVDGEATAWDERVDGAWADGKAPLALLTGLLAHMQAGETQQAVVTARQILEVEPANALVKDLLGALKLQDELEQEEREEEEEEEDDSEEEEEEDDEDSEEGDDDDEEDSDEDDGEAKDKGDKETPEDEDAAASQREEK